MNPIIPDWPAPSCVRAFSTVRSGGLSEMPYHGHQKSAGGLNLGMHVGDDAHIVRENRALLRRFLPSEPVWLNQVHGNRVVDASRSGDAPDADASFACCPDVVCVIMTADCLPVLLCRRDGKAVAAAHAGWRGLAAGVLENTVRAISEKKGADIMAWLGPAIGPDAFEVGEDVRDTFVQKDGRLSVAFEKRTGADGKYLADIYALARLTLRQAGVMQVYGGGFCTVSDESRFYSYRRDGVTGRMATGIWIDKSADSGEKC